MPNCSPPSYSYRPDFIESSVPCSMDTHQELRGRTPVGLGGTFFRTKGTGPGQNDLSIQMQGGGGGGGGGGASTFTLIVRDGSGTVETFAQSGQGTDPGDGNCPNNLIPLFRADVNTNSTYIEMPTLDYGGESASSSPLPIFDAGDLIIGDAGCLSGFDQTFFAGASGGPSTGPLSPGNPPETQPRTGPERTLYGVTLTEIVVGTSADDGQSYDPLPPEKVKQWDGTAWISYQPNVCL